MWMQQCLENGVEKARDCVDVDECERTPCLENKVCVNSLGSFLCVCKTGFIPLDSNCTDVDECVRNVSVTNCKIIQLLFMSMSFLSLNLDIL